MARATIATLEGASKRYGALTALEPTDLAIGAGEVLALLGPNGAGKTTALGLLTGRLSPDAGRARLFGQDPRDWQARRQIGVMLQEAKLPETLRVAELIRLQSGYYAAPRLLAETLELAGLVDIAQRRYSQLSGGQQRRVQFALAICGRAPLLFVDEPTVGLDVDARRNFWRVLRQLRASGSSIVLTTHYLEEADALADRIVLLAGGRVLAEDTPAGIKARASGKRVRAGTRLPAALIASWPEAQAVQMDGERCEIRTAHPEALLRRLLAADASLSELEVLPLSLEEAFLSLTNPATALPEAA
ncbi:MAG: ABC transporter ATP-binding protein [Rhodanobacteraceae bacterium]|nr:ABC transporter ATP-binding protein [Rhodanobacteraceae bacterium]